MRGKGMYDRIQKEHTAHPRDAYCDVCQPEHLFEVASPAASAREAAVAVPIAVAHLLVPTAGCQRASRGIAGVQARLIIFTRLRAFIVLIDQHTRFHNSCSSGLCWWAWWPG